MKFIYKNISVEKAAIILSKKGVQVDEKEAKIILQLLYLVSKNCDKQKNIFQIGLRIIIKSY